MKYQSLEEAQKAYADYVPQARSRGLMNTPEAFPISDFRAGESYYSLAFDQGEKQSLQQQVGGLISSPNKRDIPANLVPDFYEGRISFEELQRQIQGSPDFDLTSGPQIDFGQGKQSFTKDEQAQLEGGVPLNTIISSRMPREQFEKDSAFLKSYQFVDQQGNTQTVQAGSAEEAIKKAPNIASDSGVAEVGGQQGSAITTQSTNQTFQGIVNQANDIINQFVGMGGELTDDMKTQINQINNFDIKKNEAINQGNTAVKNNDNQGATKAVNDIKQIEAEQEQAMTNLNAKLETARSAVLDAMKPSQETTDLKAEVSDVKDRLRRKQESIQSGVDVIEGQAVPMAFIVGQSRELAKLGERQLTGLRNEYATLLDDLGLSQEADNMRAVKADKKLDFAKEDIDLQFKMEDRLQAKEDKYLEETRDLEQSAKDTLSDILTMSKDMKFDQLGSDLQNQISKLAQDAGLPLSSVINGMDLQAKEYAIEHTKQLQDTGGGGETQGGGTPSFNSVRTSEAIERGLDNITTTPSEKSAIEQDLFKSGFYSLEIPEWFRVQAETGISEMKTGLAKAVSGETPEEKAERGFLLRDLTIEDVWEEYRQSVIGGGSNNSSLGFDEL